MSNFIRKILPTICSLIGVVGTVLSIIFKRENERENINAAVKNYIDERLNK